MTYLTGTVLVAHIVAIFIAFGISLIFVSISKIKLLPDGLLLTLVLSLTVTFALYFRGQALVLFQI